MADRRVDGQTRSQRQTRTSGQTGGLAVSLHDFKVVQDGHDVLRHEDVAGVDGHAGH